jgi:ectoine hydroxylase-related dioxygenase (phytanoyl-CoA dioxygenase family)
MTAYSREQIRYHLQQVNDHGFVVISGVLEEEELAFVRQELDRIYPLYDPDRDGLRRVPGCNFSSNLVNKSPFFETLFLRSPVYDLARLILGEECILSSLNSLEPLQGRGNQGLHRDGPPMPPDGPLSMNSMWAIDNMDRENGATRLIPGSHKTGDPPPADETGVIYAEVPSGSVVVTNAHILHGASANHSGRRRRVLHGYFTRRSLPQQTPQREYLSAEVQARLSPLARRVLAIDEDCDNG